MLVRLQACKYTISILEETNRKVYVENLMKIAITTVTFIVIQFLGLIWLNTQCDGFVPSSFYQIFKADFDNGNLFLLAKGCFELIKDMELIARGLGLSYGVKMIEMLVVRLYLYCLRSLCPFSKVSLHRYPIGIIADLILITTSTSVLFTSTIM